MALTSRLKRPLKRSEGKLRDAKLIVIATEGQETEKQYFEGLFHTPRVKVDVLPSEAGASAPNYVFNRLAAYKQKYDLHRNDQLWVMVDVDRWPDKMLAEVAQKSLKKNFRLAVSNPCFELWLYLHLGDIDPDRNLSPKEMEELLRKKAGSYSRSNLKVEDFQPFIQEAVKRAKALHTNLEERWPSKTGTYVYLVVEEILK